MCRVSFSAQNEEDSVVLSFLFYTLITHRYKLADIEAGYHLLENKLDGVIKVAVEP